MIFSWTYRKRALGQKQTRGLHPRSNESESLEDGIQRSEIFRSFFRGSYCAARAEKELLKGTKEPGWELSQERRRLQWQEWQSLPRVTGEEERLVLQGLPAAHGEVLLNSSQQNPWRLRWSRIHLQCKRPGFYQKEPWKEMATHSSIFAWRIPWTEEPGQLQSVGVTKSRTQLTNTAQRNRSINGSWLSHHCCS